MDKQVLQPDDVWDPGPHLFSQAVVVTGATRFVYLAGQTSIDADGAIVGVDDVETQIRTSFDNIGRLLAAAGAALSDVVKLTAYFTDMAALDTYTRILGEVFPTVRPAQTVVQVVRLAMPELLVELDATAVL